MKKLQQIREQSKSILDEKTQEKNKLSMLVQAGLLEENKLPVLKRAIDNGNRVLTPAEQSVAMGLLESLVTQAVAELDEELQPAPTKMTDMPTVLVLKRKAIRVYPGGQNVGLYYSQQLDKYVAVPFTPGQTGKADKKSVVTMTEEQQLDEISDQLRNATYAKRVYATRKAKKDSPEQMKHLGKALKTAQRVVTTKGLSAYANMQKTADNYADVMDDTQVSKRVKKTVVKKKNPQTSSSPINPKPQEPAAPLPVFNNSRGQGKNKNKGKGKKDLSATGKLFGPTADAFVKGDLINHLAYNLGRKHRAASMAKKAQLNENPLAGIALNAARGLAMNYAKNKLADMILNRKKKKKNGNQDQDERPQRTQQQTTQKPVEKNFSPGAERKARSNPGVHNSFRDIRQRAADMSWSQNQAARRQVNESVIELDLDGNKFQLNKSVATKVQNVYESLNKTNRKKMLRMMNEGTESFNKVISFALGQ